MKMRMNKEQLSRLLSSLGGEWVVSSTIIGCPQGQSQVYLRRKRGKSGGLKISECLLNDEAEKLKDEVREYLRQR